MAVTKLKTYDEVWKLARRQAGELMEEAANDMTWENIIGSDNMTISDFVEKRFIGLEDYLVSLARRLTVADERLKHVEDSPRKRAGQALAKDYRAMFEEHLDQKAQGLIFNQVSQLLYDRRYEIPQQVRNELIEKNTANARATAATSEDMRVYDTLFNSLFEDNVVKDRTPTDQAEIDAEQRVFGRLARAIPPDRDLEPFRTRAGYINQPALAVAPQSATMVMEPSAATDVTADNFLSKIRGAKPDRVAREWGVGTFDRMMEGIYAENDRKAIKNQKNGYLPSVFVNGKSLNQWLPQKEHESERDYQTRAKCAVVAYALEGKGKVDICPYVKAGDQYQLSGPIPMKVKVNLTEEIPVWKRALRFLGIKAETKKEKAERVSLKELNEEERLTSVREQLAGIQERERSRQMALTVVNKYNDIFDKDDQAYFGFLGDSTDVINTEIQKALYNEKQDYLLATMGRGPSRTNFARLYAMSKGMTMEQVLSDDPALLDRKREIGRDMVNTFTIINESEYQKEHGDQADYQAYLAQKRREAYEVTKQIHQMVKLLPYEPMPDLSPKSLTDFYARNRFMGYALGDLFQSTSANGKKVNPAEYDTIVTEIHGMREIRHAADFVNTMTEDGYVMSHCAQEKDKGWVVSGITAKENADRYQKDISAVTLWGQIPSRVDFQWFTTAELLRRSLAEFADDPKNIEEYGRYLADAKNPVCVYDKRTGQYHVGKAAQIRQIAHEIQHGAADWQNEFEDIGLDDIRNADRKARMKAQKVTKAEAALIQEREREQKLMARAIEKSAAFEASDDMAYFGSLGDTGEERGRNIQRLVEYQDERVNIRGEKEQVPIGMINTLHRRDSRISIVRAYALTKGMTPEEILSDDPALKGRKAEIGREFLRQIAVMDKDEYEKVHGSDAGYSQYVANRERECFQMARDIHQKILDFPYEPLSDLKPETLAAAYEKNVFIRDVSQDFNQIFEPMEKNYGGEMADMTKKTRSMGEIRYMNDYSVFLAADSFVRPEKEEMNDHSMIANAVFAKENLERFMEDTRGLTSCGQLSERIGEAWGMSAVKLQVQMADKVLGDDNGYKNAARYLTTGQGRICYFDKATGNYTVGTPKEIERIQKEKEPGAGNRVKMELDELGGTKRKKSFMKPEKEGEKTLAKDAFKKGQGGMVKSGPR